MPDATPYPRDHTHRVRVVLWHPASGQRFDVTYYVNEDTDGSPDLSAAIVQAEAEHDGCFYDDVEVE